MQQLQKAKTQPKWVVQTKTLRSNQQTVEICATLNFEAKFSEGDRIPVSPQDFEKLNTYTSSLRNGGEV